MTYEKEKKTAVSFYLRPDLYNDLKRLARHRNINVGTIIDETLTAYMEANREDLEEYDKLTAELETRRKQNKTVYSKREDDVTVERENEEQEKDETEYGFYWHEVFGEERIG